MSMQEAVAEFARMAKADLVLDSTGQNTGAIRMVFHLDGVPDWTEAVIEKMNSVSPEKILPENTFPIQTISSEHLRFGTLNFQKVLDGVPAGAAFKRKDAEIDTKLKELAAKGDATGKAALLDEERAFLDAIIGSVDKVIGAEKGEHVYNIVIETGGNNVYGAPLAVSYENLPDLTEMVIKALVERGH